MKDHNWLKYTVTMLHLKLNFFLDKNRPLVRKSTLNEAVQTVAPRTLQTRRPYLSHYASLAKHLFPQKIHDAMKLKCYWRYMVDVLY